MEEIILDFSKCKRAKNTDDLYQVLKDAFQFPFDFGENPDALWDAMCYYWEDTEYVHFKFYGTKELEYRYLQMEIPYILEVFQRVHEYTPNVIFEVVS